MDLKEYNGIWKGKRCFIVGGGYSLHDFDFENLRGENVIAVNSSLEKVPFADFFITMDYRWYVWLNTGTLGESMQEAWTKFKGKRFVLDTSTSVEHRLKNFNYREDVTRLTCLGIRGYPEGLETGLYSGGNSGHAALQLALCLGADPICLLGFDMRHINPDHSHHHSPYPVRQNEGDLLNFSINFSILAREIKQRGISVVNINDPELCGLQCFEFGELNIVEPKKSDYIVVSFFTKGSDYEKDARRLKRSLRKFKIDYDIKGVEQKLESRYDWKMNTHYKPEFILQMVEKHPDKSIVWVDADAEVVKEPVKFKSFTDDVGVHMRPRPDGQQPELLSGTMIFKNNEKSREILHKWIDRNYEDQVMDKSEQINLQKVLEVVQPVSINWLPHSYVSFDIYPDDDPVIVHHQASRRYKHK